MVFNLSEVATLAQAYKDVGLGHTWNAQFLSNVATEGKQPRGRGIEIMADLLSQGHPETWPSWSRAKEFLQVAETCTIPAEAQTLKDFANQVFTGRELTDRQKAYAEKLMAGATRTVEMVELTGEVSTLLWSLDMKMNSMSQWYWGQRMATYNRLRAIFAKSGVERHCAVTSTISREDLDYVRGNFKGHVALWEKTTDYYGSLCQVHTSHVGGGPLPGGRMIDVLVVGNRTGDTYGRIMVDCLVEGVLQQVNVEKLVFPRKSRKKNSKL